MRFLSGLVVDACYAGCDCVGSLERGQQLSLLMSLIRALGPEEEAPASGLAWNGCVCVMKNGRVEAGVDKEGATRMFLSTIERHF